MRAKVIVVGAFCLLGALAFGERIELKSDAARCVIETQGARIVSYGTADHGEVLWNADPVQTAAEDWAHGGLSVCWPWFGRKPVAGIHGTAWKRPFAVLRRNSREAVLRLADPDATLTYTIALNDESLRLRLVTSNATDGVFAFSTAFHPYFRVGERDKTWLSGVKDKPFAFDTAMDGMHPGDKGSCQIVRLTDPVLGRTLSLYADNANGLCVWNPGAAKNCPGFIPGDEWRRFACVEPVAREADKVIRLAPGTEHTLAFEIRPRKGAAVTGFVGRDSR